MASTILTSKEKSELTSLARGIIERAKKTNREEAGGTNQDTKGPFDIQTIFNRLTDLEKRFENVKQQLEKTVDTTLHTLERLETCVYRLDGEIVGLKNDNQKLNGLVHRGIEAEKLELFGAAEQFSDIITSRMNELIERIEAIVDKRHAGFDKEADQ